MDIILINHYSGSPKHGMEYRPYYLAREWVALGHRVTVIAASYSHLHTTSPTVSRAITIEEIDGIRYVWLKTPHYVGNGGSRVVNMFAFAFKLHKHASEMLDGIRPQLVIASSPHPFIIWGARRLSTLSNAKLIFEVRDLWPLTLIELGNISPKHPFIRLMQYFENYSYRVADRVVSLLPKADSYMIEHGMDEKKFMYIPNGVDTAEWNRGLAALPDSHVESLQTLRSDSRFLVGYAGNHGISNALQYLVDAAALITRYPVTIVLVGKGPEKEALQRQAAKLNLNNVVFLPEIAKVAIPALLSSVDVLYIGWNRDSLYRFGVSPNKLMDYMMAGKPVIHSIEAGNDSVADSGCGFSVAPEDPRAIADAIIKLLNMTVVEREVMGQRGKRFILAHHDYSILAKKFLDVCMN
jgi:glycosyltransferase involved in cell wall biosynthesis